MTQRVKVDWLAGRHRSPVGAVVPAIAPMFGEHADLVHVKERGAGWNGFERSGELRLADMSVGLLAWGGAQQKGWAHVSITGQGCDWVKSWDTAQECLEGLEAWEVRRADLALDTFKRETCHADVLAAYRAGQFTTNGRPPKLMQIIGEDPRDGRTVYIGSRAGAKFVRGYEKGLQLAGGDELMTHIDGVPVEDWYRVEVELKAKEGPLPDDLIDRRDQYFAGCYPYLQTLLADVEPEIMVSTRERVPQLVLQAALNNIRTQYGRTIFTALSVYGGDIGAVMQRIAAREHNPDLVRAGVLLVEHE
jgi:phage replication initiation protein